MNESINYNTRVYTDIQGLKTLQYEKNSDAAKKEVAQQFEAMLMQMVMHSMRDANKSFASGLFGDEQMDLYQDLFDKQMTMLMSNSNIGFAKIVEQNMDRIQSATPHAEITPVQVMAATHSAPPPETVQDPLPNLPSEQRSGSNGSMDLDVPEKTTKFASQEQFIQTLWPIAKLAAGFIGANPAILLAQAALETNWGKNVLPRSQDGSSYNLFNIKADTNWAAKTTKVDSLEQINGVLVKEKANYRSYDSYADSFLDYVNFLRQNNRYNEALKKAPHSEQFIHALQEAGYATDQQYADKILKIYSNPSFQQSIDKARMNDLSSAKI